jgi:hypothetical protein
MKKLFYLILLFSLPAAAQDYSRAAGLRGGLSSGFTYRQHLEPEIAYEGMLSFRQGGMQFTVLRENIRPAMFEFSDDFFFTFGYGGHLGFNYTDHYIIMFQEYNYYGKRFSPLIGVDGYVGLEYRIPVIPLQVGMDLKPFFEFSMFEFFRLVPWDFAFNIKYIF